MKFSEALENFIDCKDEYENCNPEQYDGNSISERAENRKIIENNYNESKTILDDLFKKLTKINN